MAITKTKVCEHPSKEWAAEENGLVWFRCRDCGDMADPQYIDCPGR